MRLLIVEDDKRIAAALRQGLQEEGFAVDVAHDGEEGASLACAGGYDVIVLDIMLPRKDGFEVLRELRAAHVATPVLMLTARGALEDKVRGLNEGGDDYLTKLFAFAELLARVWALTRRGRESVPQLLSVADLILNPLTRTVTRGGKPIDLSPREYELLEYFLRNVGRTLTRTEIAEQIWGYHHDFGTNVIDVYVNYLRRKVDSGRRVKLIRTVRGVGYTLTDTPEG